MVYFSPPDSNDSFTRIVLGNKEYLLRFSYNYYAERWVLGIYADKSTPIVAGIKVVPNFPLMHYFKVATLPDGFICVLTTLETIGRNDFVNGNAQFVFVSNDEYKAFLEENS